MNKQIIIITAILIFIFSAIGAGYLYEKNCWKKSTKSDSPTEHRIKCKE